MSDYSEQGAVPVEDAATDDPPTVDEVMERQREEYPEQARTAMHHAPMPEGPEASITDEQQAAIDDIVPPTEREADREANERLPPLGQEIEAD